MMYLQRNGISHFVVMHETGNGLLAYHNRGRPTKEQELKRLNSSSTIDDEIVKLRQDLRLKDSSKLVLLVSLATDDMIRLVAMYPDVWFLDVTAGTNRQKRDLFMLAVRTVTGKTFPGNLTVIPSGKRWIFVCIYQLAFVALYGKETCSRNRLTLTDEDSAEYGPFENAIATMPEFSKSQLMLCVFHAVWQPYKKDVFPHLPKKAGTQILTTVGRSYGEWWMLSNYCQSDESTIPIVT